MRIDKYLWSIRSFKTRNQASTAVKKGSVRINGRVAKPAKEIYPGDKISYRLNQITYKLEVIDLPLSRVGAKLVALYCLDLTSKEIYEQIKMVRGTRDGQRYQGTGRPTKKERRDLDDFKINPDEDF